MVYFTVNIVFVIRKLLIFHYKAKLKLLLLFLFLTILLKYLVANCLAMLFELQTTVC